jgi:hypothetical protein
MLHDLYRASWDDRAQAVRFSMAGGALEVAITRSALEMLAERTLLAPSAALNEFRHRRVWIETLATLTMEERGELEILLTPADVHFQLACESEIAAMPVARFASPPRWH